MSQSVPKPCFKNTTFVFQANLLHFFQVNIIAFNHLFVARIKSTVYNNIITLYCFKNANNTTNPFGTIYETRRAL